MRKKTHFLGDARLLDSFRSLVESMATQMSVIIRRLGKTRSEEKAFGLFLNHKSVTPESLVQQYWSDRQVSWSGKHLLIYEDGSVLSFKKTKRRPDLGYIGEQTHLGGF